LAECEDDETNARSKLTDLEGKVLKLQNEVNAFPSSTQARKIQAILCDWHDHNGHLQMMVRSLFYDLDANKDGRLEWNNSEIRAFVRELFHRHDILWPNWQESVFYEMYRRADTDRSYSLELQEATRFAQNCFEVALAMVLAGISPNGLDMTSIEEWSKHAVPPLTSAMTFACGVTIDFIECREVFTPVAVANRDHHTRMIRMLDSGEHMQTTMSIYRECDRDGNGFLTWNNGEIRNFISACFRQHGLTPPEEEHLYHIYSKFDRDRNHALDMRECLDMVDALFRSIFVSQTRLSTASAMNVKVQETGLVKTVPSTVMTGSKESLKGSATTRGSPSPQRARIGREAFMRSNQTSQTGSFQVSQASPQRNSRSSLRTDSNLGAPGMPLRRDYSYLTNTETLAGRNSLQHSSLRFVHTSPQIDQATPPRREAKILVLPLQESSLDGVRIAATIAPHRESRTGSIQIRGVSPERIGAAMVRIPSPASGRVSPLPGPRRRSPSSEQVVAVKVAVHNSNAICFPRTMSPFQDGGSISSSMRTLPGLSAPMSPGSSMRALVSQS